VCLPHLLAVAPHIHPHGSGVATCQLADPSHSDSDDEQQQQGTVWDHSEQHGVSDSLPELEQLLHSNRRLLVTLLVDAAPRRYQQAQQQQQQQHPGHDPKASGSGASSGTNKESDTPNCSRNSSGSGHISTGSPWMHKELHQYLLELQTGEWGPPLAAAAATSGCSGSASCSHQAADCCCGVGDTPPPQAAAAAHTWVPVSQLAWMAAAHPWAARATNARVDTAPPLLMLPGNGRHHLPADTASSSVSTTSRSVAEHLASCGSGSSTHPNLAPVLLLADNCSSCSENATLLPGTAVEDAVAAPAAAGDASSAAAAAAAAAAVAAPATTAASTTPATTSCSVTRCAAVSAQPSAPLDGLLLHYRHHLSGTPDWLGGDWHCRFLLFQLLRALQHLHSKGLAMGGLRAEQLSLVVPGWLLLLAHPAAGLVQPAPLLLPQEVVDPGVADHRAAAASMSLRALPEPCPALPQLTVLWRERRLSNWEYLMWLNAAAGRRWGDRARHPLLPWVLDFTCEPGVMSVENATMQPPHQGQAEHL
jgi:Beige/BEACH domain